MNSLSRIAESGLLRIWSDHNRIILLAGIFLMAAYAAVSLGDQFHRLIFDQGRLGAIDLKNRHYEVYAFFSGKERLSPYPPASFPILWPFLGWVPIDAARWLWAAVCIISLAWLSHLSVRGGAADHGVEAVFLILCLLSMNATGLTIGSGQLGIFILPLLVAGLGVIRNNRTHSLWRDLLAAIMMIAALVKPSVSAPFFWIALFSGRLQAALLIVLGYLLLTGFAATFQQAGITELMINWLTLSSNLGAMTGKGSTNLHIIIPRGLNMEFSLVSLLLFGIWVYCHRHANLWILLGITGIFARLWTYHRIYDDVLIFLPMVALFSLMKEKNTGSRGSLVAGVLLGTAVLVNFIPSRVQHRWASPWPEIYSFTHLVLWLSIFVFLVYMAGPASRACGQKGQMKLR